MQMIGRIKGRLGFLIPAPSPGNPVNKPRLEKKPVLTFLEIGRVERETDKLVDEPSTVLLPGGSINLINNDADG